MAVPPLPPKQVLRDKLRNLRDDFVSALKNDERSALEGALAMRLHGALGAARIIAAYLPLGSEVDPLPFLHLNRQNDVIFALPHVSRDPESLRFLAWAPGDAVEAGPFGLRQPSAGAAEVSPEAILVPLLGFDNHRNRLGYGGGYYDRALLRHGSARRIGLAWSLQRCDAVPVDSWDIKMDAIATELEWLA